MAGLLFIESAAALPMLLRCRCHCATERWCAHAVNSLWHLIVAEESSGEEEEEEEEEESEEEPSPAPAAAKKQPKRQELLLDARAAQQRQQQQQQQQQAAKRPAEAAQTPQPTKKAKGEQLKAPATAPAKVAAAGQAEPTNEREYVAALKEVLQAGPLKLAQVGAGGRCRVGSNEHAGCTAGVFGRSTAVPAAGHVPALSPAQLK